MVDPLLKCEGFSLGLTRVWIEVIIRDFWNLYERD